MNKSSALKFFTGSLNEIEREQERWVTKWEEDSDIEFEISGIELIESELYGYVLLINYTLTVKS